MNLENDKILRLIFPDGVPENLRENPELYNYLGKLGTYKVDQLKKEQNRLTEQTKHICEQTEDLAITNYKTFIQTAENSRFIFNEFQNTEEQVSTLIEKLPKFSGKCEEFLNKSSEINENRRLNSITLKKNAQLLEILELPQLMERCIRESRYEEALELASYVQKIGENQGQIPVMKNIVHAIEALWHTMLVQLIAQLRTDLQLPKCLQIVGFLRRMQAFTSNELKLKFLQTRNSWLAASLQAIPKDDAQQHLTKTIEVTRVNLFNIVTLYRAIFPQIEDEPKAKDETTQIDENTEYINFDGDRLFQAWLHAKIDEFLCTLSSDLEGGVSSLDTVLGQCMYFGLSFGRVGADFRTLIAPIFVRVIKSKFDRSIENVNQTFEHALEKYTLINKITLHSRSKSEVVATSQTPPAEPESYSPPEALLDFHPLALLCNGYLNALNELRLCAPIALANDVTQTLQYSLEMASQRILAFYRQEQQAFTGGEREVFAKLCACFAYELVPYLQRCIHAIFEEEALSAYLGVNLLNLEQEHISYLKQLEIQEPLKLLLPIKVDVVVKAEADTATTTEPGDADVNVNVVVVAES